MKVAVIGGGAAGFFAAINAAENYPKASIVIFEKSQKLLSKVKISGGGRCNVTNGEDAISKLCEAYPRGAKKLKKLFREFSTRETIAWFESRGVPLMTQEDNCVFPVSQDSQSIIDCFLNECKKKKIEIIKGASIDSFVATEEGVTLCFKTDEREKQLFDKVIVATGGSPKRRGLEWIEKQNHNIKDPVPSLFTFNMPQEKIVALMGIVIDPVLVSIQKTKLKADGPLLITHWGMSGPAILKLSAFGARNLEETAYNFKINVNWVNETNHQKIYDDLKGISDSHSKKKLVNFRPYNLPDRFWQFQLEKWDFPPTKLWGELGKKGIHKLVNALSHDEYQVSGKTTFKEEFVTCGGVSLGDIDFNTMQSRKSPNVYFAGEVLDIDGITGGYNFQSCWTTAFVASRLS